ncbi:MAG: hypothetical protein KatS3mg016_2103 [Fimbriimonadales bacterium]|nr:MAG: hypothetical protein KatS3mg016_2103 [Fimbriimonadales bacterium]
MRAILISLLLLCTVSALAQPKLLLILVHEPIAPEAFVGAIPAQIAWVVWECGENEPYHLATGAKVRSSHKQFAAIELKPPVNTSSNRSLLTLRHEKRRTDLPSITLGARLIQAGQKGIYLATRQSPVPSAFAMIVMSNAGLAPARVYPDIEALRLDFFQIKAEWAVLEMSRWNYSALELLLAEGVEVWVVGIPSPKGLHFTRTRLSAVARYAAREPRGLLTSPSTRWNGVIREVDIAPTLYHALTGNLAGGWTGAPVLETRQSDWHRYWNGWLIRLALQEATAPAGIGWHGNALRRSAEWALAKEHLVSAINSALLVFCGAWLSIGIALWRTQRLRKVWRRVFVSGLAVFCLIPAVAILYAYYPFDYWSGELYRDLISIGSWLTMSWAVLSLLAAGLARWGNAPLCCCAAMVALVVIGADILIAGGYGVKRSLLSAGITGDGSVFSVNEWFWGFGLAMALLAPASWLESRGRALLGTRGQTVLGMAYGLLLGLFGAPMLGAALDAWIPLILAFGLGIGIYTGILRSPIRMRNGVFLILALLALGGAFTGLAVVFDATQPWTRQAGWARNWQTALGWRFAPVEIALVAGVAATVFYALRPKLLGLRRTLVLNSALGECLIVAVTVLLLGKTVASAVILVLSLLFTLEYLIGGKEWGYAYEGNGVAH